MINEFSKEIFMNNIYYLLKAKSMKVGEVEKAIGVSIGYLAKLKKDAGLRPGIDLVIKIAEKLEVSIDTLIGVDMEKLTGTEQYLLCFVEKLKTDTEAEKLEWWRETASQLAAVETDINGCPDHPFFSYEEFYEDRGGDYPDRVSEVVFVSNAFGPHTAIHGDCYNLRMKNGARLFLADIVKSIYRQTETDVYAKEIWMQTASAGNQFLCSNRNPQYSAFVNNLFTAVAEYCKHPHLGAAYRNVIDAFMKDDLEDDPFSEEPPF